MSWNNPCSAQYNKVVGQDDFVPPSPSRPTTSLPKKLRLAQTGLPENRPKNLRVCKHVVNNVATTFSIADMDRLQRPAPEPILQEDRAMVDTEAQKYNDLEVLDSLHVYEYNQPDVFRRSNAPDDTLFFDSLFENGNLQKAVRVFRKRSTGSQTLQQEYELVIHPDVNNGAYRQWFYFQVRNGRPGTTYRFALVNLAKRRSLFGQGLQPVVYSQHNARANGIGWRHCGTFVRYDVSVSTLAPLGANTLSFQYEFEHQNDCVFFACLQPYTYTDLMDYLEQLERDPERMQLLCRTELCQTIAGNTCDLLSITSPEINELLLDERRIIVLSARVHPGEPNSSWIMKGMIDYLTGPSSGATILRQHFIFKIVPMLNPDGVINGNTRVNLAGCDLNRKWSQPIEQFFPTIYHLKQHLAYYQSTNRVAIYCDIHGHSLNRNIFMYGCYPLSRKSSISDVLFTPSFIARDNSDPRAFPVIVARHTSCFSLPGCNFKIHKSKVSTARVVVNQELGVTNSYTLEASFCGPDVGKNKDTQFSTYDLEDVGRAWCQSLIVYYGLTNEVEALDAEQTRVEKLENQQEVVADQNTSIQNITSSMHGMAEDKETRFEKGVLGDGDTATAAPFTQSDCKVNDIINFQESNAQISDLSSGEEAPDLPTFELEESRNQKNTTTNRFWITESHSQRERENMKTSGITKSKFVMCHLTSKGPNAARTKRKGKPKIRRFNSEMATSSMRSIRDDAATSFRNLAVLAARPVEEASNRNGKQVSSVSHSNSITARTKGSSKTSLLQLPNVFLRRNRISKTAPAYERNFSKREDQSYFNLTKLRADLPVLPLSGRNQNLRRQT
ncbi:aps kinase atp sulfurlyase pyrophosphatase fusion protein [Plasmopara halstedii]|uniref:Aps kinase atp sulfurlyase pyrophosphatase fusion protein n=1 Tax=Plasmopara halstedii TaxID=4781 RepID=A0A0P1B225_PLAHL|nr:aps kinase atp sulfurlyase pyrophosphatase fusion protein [Plasmopara halstedii]CEG47357.1 aps kinase atp sulfurlyase pyrophosphatase fusion protein [Plasmopara halstedii]|eukprot:XP_024583726.1 aps kinase atp sulfurlyase pyrophosphatase fusion protein [Plasmopara halstedii]